MKRVQNGDVGPFKVGFAPISHSIPESSACIDTPDGRVLHSGDLKSTRIQVLRTFDRDMFKDIAKRDHALVCDSTMYFPCTPADQRPR